MRLVRSFIHSFIRSFIRAFSSICSFISVPFYRGIITNLIIPVAPESFCRCCSIHIFLLVSLFFLLTDSGTSGWKVADRFCFQQA